jgi:hypothetical protein
MPSVCQAIGVAEQHPGHISNTTALVIIRALCIFGVCKLVFNGRLHFDTVVQLFEKLMVPRDRRTVGYSNAFTTFLDEQTCHAHPKIRQACEYL